MSRASVVVAGETIATIGVGLLVFVGVTHGDDDETARALAAKVWNLRIFGDATGRMDRAVGDVGGSLCVVSQFTLYADTTRGRRPSWAAAAPGVIAEPLVEAFAASLRQLGGLVETGIFAADMAVELVNDGPVTVLLEA